MKGIVYCIKEISTNEIIYVGSTTLGIEKRLRLHISACYTGNNVIPVYDHIRKICNKRENFNKYFLSLELQSIEFEDRTELLKIEREYIDKLNPKFNKAKPWLTNEEKRASYEMQKKRCVISHQLKPEKYKKQHHDWVDNNREAYNAYRKEYRLRKRLNETQEEKEKRLAYQRDYMRKRRELKKLDELNQTENHGI